MAGWPTAGKNLIAYVDIGVIAATIYLFIYYIPMNDTDVSEMHNNRITLFFKETCNLRCILYCSKSYGPRRDKTCLRSFRQSEIQTSHLGYRDLLVNWKFAPSKSRYGTFQYGNNKGADQAARMRRLVCAFVVRNYRRQVFLLWGPYIPV